MPVGAHVRAGGDLLPALERGRKMGADCIQVFTQSPRAWKPTQYSDAVLSAYRAAQEADTQVTATFCHATYLINLAAPDPDVRGRSRACLLDNFAMATGMGAAGLVLHVGSHRGRGFAASLSQVVDGLLATLDSQPDGHCPLVLENAAGTGDTVGRTFEELAAILDAAGRLAAPRLKVCLDTQHLWASGVDFANVEKADDVVATFDVTIGRERLACLHLNDSKVGLGANRDRHENIGRGTIGAMGLGALVSHPTLVALPAILEVPGLGGHGPAAEDIIVARQAIDAGIALRRPS